MEGFLSIAILLVILPFHIEGHETLENRNRPDGRKHPSPLDLDGGLEEIG